MTVRLGWEIVLFSPRWRAVWLSVATASTLPACEEFSEAADRVALLFPLATARTVLDNGIFWSRTVTVLSSPLVRARSGLW